MNQKQFSISGRAPWLASALSAALIAALVRWWQLRSAFEPGTGLAVPRAPASVILTCVLAMAAAWLVILALYQPVVRHPFHLGQAHRWDQVFLDAGDPVYPLLVVSAAFLALAAAPVLLPAGFRLWRAYRAAMAAIAQGVNVQAPSNNGVLVIATAAGAVLAFLGLLQMGRDGLHPGQRGKGGFAAALPGIAGCVWLMESFRGHAANPVLWDYAPLLLAITCGMLFYMDFAGMSAGAARPRRLLWMAAMTLVLSGPAMVSAAAVGSPGDLLLLAAQTLTAAAVLWRLPPSLEALPRSRGAAPAQPRPTQEIQEDSTDE